jgi:hypothetical protein
MISHPLKMWILVIVINMASSSLDSVFYLKDCTLSRASCLVDDNTDVNRIPIILGIFIGTLLAPFHHIVGAF